MGENMRPDNNEYTPIYDFLGVGRDQAKTKDEIIKTLSFRNERQLRSEVARERLLHCPIIVTPDGKYYNSYSRKELNDCIKGLLIKRDSIGEVAQAMSEITPDTDNIHDINGQFVEISGDHGDDGANEGTK